MAKTPALLGLPDALAWPVLISSVMKGTSYGWRRYGASSTWCAKTAAPAADGPTLSTSAVRRRGPTPAERTRRVKLAPNSAARFCRPERRDNVAVALENALNLPPAWGAWRR